MRIYDNGVYRDATPEEEKRYAEDSISYPVANRPLSKGEYFNIENEIYRATTFIPAGDMIIPNTNCEQMNITDILNTR